MTFKNDPELASWVALGMLPRIGGKNFSRLLEIFGTPAGVLAASYNDLLAVPGIGDYTARQILSADPIQVDQQLKQWQQKGVQVVTVQDETYPHLLKTVDDAAPVLFALGEWQANLQRTVAIVGTRHPSTLASNYARTLAKFLVHEGWVVVSGLALGIDTAAHYGALAASVEGCRSIAFQGCGVWVDYPPENRALKAKIIENGVVFSEVAPQVTPTASLLVARNRLISAMSQAVVVIETGDPGGALYAARFAREQQRPVWTLDFPKMAGNQRLIREGAHVLPPEFDENAILEFVEALNSYRSP